MVGVNFFGNFDLASLAIWGFWLFFAYLIYYLQTENMREGYPLEDEDGEIAPNQGPFPVPEPKTFKLRDGRGEVTVPSPENEEAHRRQNLALERTATANGFPLAPTGNPLADGVGPASWAPRRDEPELDGHGHPKISPMAGHADFFVSAGRDPRGLPVLSRDDQVVGHIKEMWVDAAEQMVRYLEYDLEPEWGEGSRLVPITLTRIKDRWVMVKTLKAADFNGVPKIAGTDQITKLEEDKVSAYYAGGPLFS
ncbi:photosynthetic reaction center subunit H [Ovoidimarina sediminis]|uniref:photosynthetic reaction center subunit H n=1 Tax=Ovoidimarina sediminis TaxID=3079856 RepID=UPI00290CF17F|nr:photosynthetic reaction center subunit H [Rhodophyticola sp. MJ-SS7]MDU8944496.1 photosynthetic reaction center subunit H [Rhodophyticola sp. MJ-SS7]